MAAPSDTGTTFQTFEYILAGISSVLGGLITFAGIAWRRGQIDGVASARQAAIEDAQRNLRADLDRHIERTEEEIKAISAKIDASRDQFGDMRANMATRADIAALTAAMQTAFAGLSARMDGLAHPHLK